MVKTTPFSVTLMSEKEKSHKKLLMGFFLCNVLIAISGEPLYFLLQWSIALSGLAAFAAVTHV